MFNYTEKKSFASFKKKPLSVFPGRVSALLATIKNGETTSIGIENG